MLDRLTTLDSKDLYLAPPWKDLFTKSVTPLSTVAGYHVIHILKDVVLHNMLTQQIQDFFCRCDMALSMILQLGPEDEC